MSDDYHHRVDNNNNNFLIGLILGGIIGAGVTYLFTTEKGQELKEKLKKQAPDLLEQLEELVAEVEDKSEELEEKAEEVKELITKRLGPSKALNEIEEKVSNLKESGRNFVKAVNPNLARRFFHRRKNQ